MEKMQTAPKFEPFVQCEVVLYECLGREGEGEGCCYRVGTEEWRIMKGEQQETGLWEYDGECQICQPGEVRGEVCVV